MILILIIAVPSVTYASTPLKDIIDKQSINYSPEKNIVLNAQINSKMKPKDFLFETQKNNIILKAKGKEIKSKDDIVYGNVFKEYHLIPPISNASNLYNQLLNSSYGWKFPIYLREANGTNLPISSALIEKTPDENYWHLVATNTQSYPDICDILSDSNKLAKVIEDSGIYSANNILIFDMLEQDFVYVSTNDSDYIIPLFSYGDSWFGMKTMTKYTTKDFVNYMTAYINSLQANTGGLPKTPKTAITSKTKYLYFVLSLLFIISFALFINAKIKLSPKKK